MQQPAQQAVLTVPTSSAALNPDRTYDLYIYAAGHHGYDPFYSHRRWEHRGDRDWERRDQTGSCPVPGPGDAGGGRPMDDRAEA